MNLAASVRRQLTERLGLSAELLGCVAVQRALNVALGGEGTAGREERAAHLLQGRGEEWETLVDEVIVPETWFFRGREPFRLLASRVRKEWQAANPTGSFRALCIPCASGEEPYSVAMTLLDAGLDASRIRVEAGDVSERALARAARAVYGKSSFREESIATGEKYFVESAEGRRVREEIKALVSFHKANLLDLSAYRLRLPYHAVFCRNALIYFEEAARRQVIGGLRELVQEDGLLFTGHTELMLFLKSGFQLVDYPLSFACRKPSRVERQESKVEKHPQLSTLDSRRLKSTVDGRQSIVEDHVRLSTSDSRLSTLDSRLSTPAPRLPTLLEEAEQLADRGELAAATSICERLLAEGKQDPNIYSLLGVINESGGNVEAAEDLFRKALFLDPGHYQSLVQMSLLAEQRGDRASAGLYRARAGRVFERQEGGQRVA